MARAIASALALFAACAAVSTARADSPIPCKVLDPELQTQYRGGCRRGLAHGDGVASGAATYEGAFRNGMKHGYGIKTWPWGDRYAGLFADDRKHGTGVYTWGAGSVWAGERYEGEFEQDRRHGIGVYTWPTGDRFEGEWTADQRNAPAAMEMRRELARGAQLDAFKPGVTVCLLSAATRSEVGSVRGVVDTFDGNTLAIRLVELPLGLSAGPAAAFRVGQVVQDEPVEWAPCS